MAIPKRPQRPVEETETQACKKYKEEKAYEKDHRIEDEFDDEYLDDEETGDDNDAAEDDEEFDDDGGATEEDVFEAGSAGTGIREEDAQGEVRVSTENAPHPILYSRKAYNDGYRFNMFSREDQQLTNQLYISEDAISNLILANDRMSAIVENPEDRGRIDFGWGLSIDGWHYGIVYTCSQSKNNPDRYVLQLLLTGRDVRNFTFSLSLMDPVYTAIKRERNLGGNFFRPANYGAICGAIVIFRVTNVTTANGTLFSNIVDFHFLSKREITLLDRMKNIMIKQSREFTRDAN